MNSIMNLLSVATAFLKFSGKDTFTFGNESNNVTLQVSDLLLFLVSLTNLTRASRAIWKQVKHPE